MCSGNAVWTNRDLGPVESRDTEAGEFLRVARRHILKDAQRNRLAQFQTSHSVGTIVDAGGIAAQSDIVSELVQLSTYGQRWTGIGDQGGSIGVRHHRVRNRRRTIIESLQDGHART